MKVIFSFRYEVRCDDDRYVAGGHNVSAPKFETIKNSQSAEFSLIFENSYTFVLCYDFVVAELSHDICKGFRFHIPELFRVDSRGCWREIVHCELRE